MHVNEPLRAVAICSRASMTDSALRIYKIQLFGFKTTNHQHAHPLSITVAVNRKYHFGRKTGRGASGSSSTTSEIRSSSNGTRDNFRSTSPRRRANRRGHLAARKSSPMCGRFRRMARDFINANVSVTDRNLASNQNGPEAGNRR